APRCRASRYWPPAENSCRLFFADQLLRRANAGRGVDEEKPVAKASVQKDGNRGEWRATVALHEIGADVGLADIEFGTPRHAPVPLARAHAGEHDELEAVSGNRAVLERAHDLVVAACNRQPKLSRQ